MVAKMKYDFYIKIFYLIFRTLKKKFNSSNFLLLEKKRFKPSPNYIFWLIKMF